MKLKNIVLVLISILILSLSSGTALADCCLAGDTSSDPNNPDYFSCYYLGIQETDGVLIETETQCVDEYSGTYDSAECHELDACTPGCCCLPQPNEDGDTGFQSSQFICQNIIDQEPLAFFSAEETVSCNDYCSATGTETFPVSGTVIDTDGNPVQGANVEIYANGQLVNEDNPITTPATGEFQLLEVNAGSIDVGASHGVCTGSVLGLVNQDPGLTGIIVELNECEGGAGDEDCVPPVWDCEWDDPEDLGRDCGWPIEDSCVNTNPPGPDEEACLTPKAPDEPPVLSIPCPSTSDCGDGEVTGTEQCDCGEDGECTSEELGGNTCDSLNMGLDNPGLSCTSDCLFDYTGCTVCPTQDTGSCSDEQCFMGCGICIEQGYCDAYNECENFQLDISDSDVDAIPETARVELSWSQSGDICIANMERAHIERCRLNDETGICEPEHNTTVEGEFTEVNTFIDTNPLEPASIGEPRPHYCYTVYAIVNIDGVETKWKTTSPGCIDAGDPDCMQEHGIEMCSQTSDLYVAAEGLVGPNIRSYCDGENVLQLLYADYPEIVNEQGPFDCGVDSYGEELACLGPYYSQGEMTRCGQTNICELCNGLFAMYNHIGSLQVPYFDENGQTLRACQQVYADECFEQASLTTMDQYESCGQINSCYDYHTQESCEETGNEDPCNSIPGDCEWRELVDLDTPEGAEVGEELGLGICMPAEEDEQNCGLCNEDTHLSPGCTKDLCDLYGDDCFYVETHWSGAIFSQDMVGQCLSTDELGCAFYSSEEECVGSEGISVSVNAQYESNNDEDSRFSGTHIKTESTDGNFGTCQWVSNDLGQEYCIKNADNFTGVNVDDDCFISPLNLRPRCWADNEAPVTTIYLRDAEFGDYPVYGPNEDVGFSVEVVDNEYEQGNLVDGLIKAKFAYDARENFEVLMTNFPSDGTIIQQDSAHLTGTQACSTYGGFCLGDFHFACGDGDWTLLESGSQFCNSGIGWELFNPDIEMPEGGDVLSIPEDLHELANQIWVAENCAWKVSCAPQAAIPYPSYTIQEIDGLYVPSTVYDLYYYSEDGAKNLEEINSVALEIDSTVPQLTNYQREAEDYEIEADLWRTDVIFSYDVDETHGDAYCSAMMQRIDGLSGFDGDFTGEGHHFEQEYTALPSGIYQWVLNCSDMFNNEVSYPKAILIDADKSITNVSPVLEWFNTTTVNISLDTPNEAQCVYRMDGPPSQVPGDGTLFETLDNHEHTAELTGLEANRIHYAYPGCYFPGSGRTTSGDPGDIMIFSIDQSAPTTTLREHPSGLAYEPIGWTSEEELYFDCNDDNPELLLPAVVGEGFNLNAGEDYVEYCLSAEAGINPETECEHILWDRNPITITNETVAELGGYAHLYYSCTDEGANQEDWKETAVLVKDTRFDRPRIMICNPATDECRPSDNSP